MRAERLQTILREFLADQRATKIEALLRSLIGALKREIASPSSVNQSSIKSARSALRDALYKSRFNSYPPTLMRTLERVGFDHLVGSSFYRNVERRLEGNEITPAIALRGLEEELTSLRRAKIHSSRYVSALRFLNVEADKLDPGQFEITIAIPREAVDNELHEFGRETIKLDRMLGLFAELATGSREHSKIRAIASTDLTVFLDSAPAVAALFATTLERIAALYEKALTIIKMHREMRQLNVPDSVTDALKLHIEDTVNKGLGEISEQIENEMLVHVDDGRRQELSTELQQTLRELAARIDNGYAFDVQGENAAKTDDADHRASVNKAAEQVRHSRPRLLSFKVESEPILGLPKPANDQP